MEIHSPGQLLGGIEVEQMEYLTHTRNELIIRLLIDLHPSKRWGAIPDYIGRRGHGVRYIMEESERFSRKKPKYEIENSGLCLTIFAKEDET